MQSRSDRLKDDIVDRRDQYDIEFLVSLKQLQHLVCQSYADAFLVLLSFTILPKALGKRRSATI